MAYKNKADQAACARRWYLNHKEICDRKAREGNQKRRLITRAFIREVKSAGCGVCKISDHRVLDFHHVGEKETNIATAVAMNWPLEKIKEELKKCVILCANCHRIHHYDENH